MNTKFFRSYYSYIFLAILFFGICAAIGMLLEPDSYYKLISEAQIHRKVPPMLPHKSYYWDVASYADMVLDLKCTAFYPLWPILINFLFEPNNLESAAHLMVKVSMFFFIFCNFLFFGLFCKIFKNYYYSFLILMAFNLNPMSIFRVNGYTESFFTVLSAALIYALLPSERKGKGASHLCNEYLHALQR